MKLKKTIVRVAAAVLMVVFFTASPASADSYLAIGTAAATGTWYPLGAGLSTVINENTEGIRATVESTKGGEANVHHLARKDMEIALVPPWSIADAFHGRDKYAGVEGFPAKVAGWFAFAPNDLTIMVRKGSGIQSIKDFRGKSVNLGAPGTFNRPILEMVLETYGMSTDDVSGIDIAIASAANRLKDRQIDAIWWWSATPASAFTDASVSIETRLIGIEPPMIEKLLEKYPWFTPSTINPGAYRGNDTKIQTLSTKIVAAMTADVPSQVAYDATKAVFENLETLGKLHPVFKGLNKETALIGLTVPLHPGVLKYYEEQNFPGLDAFLNSVGKL